MRESERYNEYELVYMILQGDEHSLQLLISISRRSTRSSSKTALIRS